MAQGTSRALKLNKQNAQRCFSFQVLPCSAGRLKVLHQSRCVCSSSCGASSDRGGHEQSKPLDSVCTCRSDSADEWVRRAMSVKGSFVEAFQKDILECQLTKL